MLPSASAQQKWDNSRRNQKSWDNLTVHRPAKRCCFQIELGVLLCPMGHVTPSITSTKWDISLRTFWISSTKMGNFKPLPKEKVGQFWLYTDQQRVASFEIYTGFYHLCISFYSLYQFNKNGTKMEKWKTFLNATKTYFFNLTVHRPSKSFCVQLEIGVLPCPMGHVTLCISSTKWDISKRA